MNNQPAFPLQSIGPEFPPGYSGMTLLDYFAAKAMVAGINDSKLPPAYSFADVANRAYLMAEAMMAERAKRVQKKSGT